MYAFALALWRSVSCEPTCGDVAAAVVISVGFAEWKLQNYTAAQVIRSVEKSRPSLASEFWLMSWDSVSVYQRLENDEKMLLLDLDQKVLKDELK